MKLLEQDTMMLFLYPKVSPCCGRTRFSLLLFEFLAGTDQCLANTTDPDHEWIYDSWTYKDKRLPLVTSDMNNYD